jgi:ribose 5-phosphate isomerase B
MKLAIASDHAGFRLKEELVPWLSGRDGVQVTDLGPDCSDSVDYPDFAGALCRHLISGQADRGILICNSGIGMSMSANRFKGIRAALCLYPGMARWARHHNDANVLVLGGGLTAPFLAREIVEVFLGETFDGGRHERRICKMDSLDGNGSI